MLKTVLQEPIMITYILLLYSRPDRRGLSSSGCRARALADTLTIVFKELKYVIETKSSHVVCLLKHKAAAHLPLTSAETSCSLSLSPASHAVL